MGTPNRAIPRAGPEGTKYSQRSNNTLLHVVAVNGRQGRPLQRCSFTRFRIIFTPFSCCWFCSFTWLFSKNLYQRGNRCRMALGGSMEGITFPCPYRQQAKPLDYSLTHGLWFPHSTKLETASVRGGTAVLLCKPSYPGSPNPSSMTDPWSDGRVAGDQLRETGCGCRPANAVTVHLVHM